MTEQYHMKEDKSFELELPADVWLCIESEALREGISVDRLIGLLFKKTQRKRTPIRTRKSPGVKRG